MSRDERRIERNMQRAINRSRPDPAGSDDDLSDTIVWMVVIVGGGLALLSAGLGWLDHQFGWGLREGLFSFLQGLFK